MAIFNSYVNLPEGMVGPIIKLESFQQQHEIDQLVRCPQSNVINDFKYQKKHLESLKHGFLLFWVKTCWHTHTQLLGCSPDKVYQQENGTIRAMVWIQKDCLSWCHLLVFTMGLYHPISTVYILYNYPQSIESSIYLSSIYSTDSR